MVLFYVVAHSGCAVLKTGRRRGTCTPPSLRSCWQVLPSENLGRDFVLPGARCRKKEKLPVPRVTKISTVHLFISNLTRAVWGLDKASHYGGPWCSPTAWWWYEKHLHVPESPIYSKMGCLKVLSVLTI